MKEDLWDKKSHIGFLNEKNENKQCNQERDNVPRLILFQKNKNRKVVSWRKILKTQEVGFWYYNSSVGST